MGQLVDVGDTRLYVEERGDGDLPLFVLHGGPGLDHTMFGSTLDALGDTCRLLLVDERAQGRSDRDVPPLTWTLTQMAADIDALAAALELDRYAVLGHSFGAFIALQHAVETRRPPVATIISSGLPSERWLEDLDDKLAAFEPVELREQVQASWAREASAQTEDEVREILRDQLPWHFADPRDPRIADVLAPAARFAPEVLRAAASEGYGHLDVEDRLGEIAHPVLVMTGRHDRLCTAEAAEFTAGKIPSAQLVILEHSAHMGFVEENEAYLRALRDFLTTV